jgi:hypothetical protein
LERWERGPRRRWCWVCKEVVRKTMLVRLPRVPDLHDSRALPVSEMDGPTGIVDRIAKQLMLDDGALFGKHWTFSVSADAQTGKQSACSTSKCFCLVGGIGAS